MATNLQEAVIAYVGKYAQFGILLDTNILLLYVIGNYDLNRIEKFKRTNTFSANDYKLLIEFLSHFRRIVATPHVLTEVSNLTANLKEPDKNACFESFARDIDSFDEHTEAARSIAKTPEFKRFGITDASLPLIAKNKFLVLTEDLEFYAHLLRCEVDAINFNHIRPFGWNL